MTTTRVALLFGGRSSEHSISCATAAGVLSELDRDRFEVVPIGITQAGAFTLASGDADVWRLNPQSMPVVPDNGTRVVWPSEPGTRELQVIEDGTVRSLGRIDVVLPMLHGPFGEDGTIQGMLDLLGFPYVGSGVLGHAVGMNKHVSKTVLQAAGIAVAPWVSVTPGSWIYERDRILADVQQLELPLFVKPARAGSSVGVTKVKNLDSLSHAIEVAFHEDDLVLIEQGITGREIEIGVLGSTGTKPPRVSVAGEIVLTGPEFYDYEAKYLGTSGVDVVCPADVSPQLHTRIADIALAAVAALGVEHLARVDVFVTGDGEQIIVNELNTMPGFTPISMYPKCWQASGIEYTDLLTQLLELALDRGPYTPSSSLSH